MQNTLNYYDVRYINKLALPKPKKGVKCVILRFEFKYFDTFRQQMCPFIVYQFSQ